MYPPGTHALILNMFKNLVLNTYSYSSISEILQKKEVNKILADIIKHMTPDRAFEDFYSQLQSVVTKILAHIHDFSVLFSIVSLGTGNQWEKY